MNKRTDSTERQGVNDCGSAFERLGFIFRPQPIADYGIDAIIETQNDDYATGKMIAVQIKTGDSYFKRMKDGRVTYRGEMKHYHYWMNHSLPVIIVLCSPSSGVIIWERINRQTAVKCERGWKVEIPCSQTLQSSKDKLLSLAMQQSEYERRWTSLVIAKEWILETAKRGALILEVQEWVNKTSGRGTFILKAEEDDGTEKLLFSRELFGFGCKKYELVIQELFPWANVEIDEAFYEANKDDDCDERRNITDRQVAAMLGYEGEELLNFSDVPSRLYPYSNASGEVDFYRLQLTLNQLGKSFVEMEHFLETGKCYFLDNFE